MQEHNKKERQGDVVFEIRETTMEGWEAAWMLQDHAQKLRNAYNLTKRKCRKPFVGNTKEDRHPEDPLL